MRREAGPQTAEQTDAEAAQAAAMIERKAPARFKGIPDGADGGAFGDFEQRPGDGGEEVGVLVGIDMGNGDAGVLQLLDLGESFAGDLVLLNVAAEERLQEVEKGWAKGLSVGAEQAGDGFARGDGSSVGEDDVSADTERWVRAGDSDGVVEGGAGGHQRGGGEDAGGG